eukprot:TRINITY_DN13663_c0_g1_i2.p2 TRINITY_DN13663_c0_g1~~TRINITY_DN13663_c0_g1_i2.p2  ORF type:complete len:202 (+),score=26.84 TRINITY_DN13663_c0_g1_i2:207-812(+)
MAFNITVSPKTVILHERVNNITSKTSISLSLRVGGSSLKTNAAKKSHEGSYERCFNESFVFEVLGTPEFEVSVLKEGWFFDDTIGTGKCIINKELQSFGERRVIDIKNKKGIVAMVIVDLGEIRWPIELSFPILQWNSDSPSSMQRSNNSNFAFSVNRSTYSHSRSLSNESSMSRNFPSANNLFLSRRPIFDFSNPAFKVL